MWEFPILSEKEKRILAFIKDYMKRSRSAPSLQEIRNYCGNKSSSTAHKALEQLEAKGYIERNKHYARSLALTDLALHFLGEFRPHTLPLYGTVRAGPGGEWNFDDLYAKDYVDVPNSTIKDGRFVIRVKGDSMDGFVHDGDDVIIDNMRDTPPLNRIVIVLLNGDAYIKRLIKRDEKQFILRSENPRYADILVSKDDDFHIKGEVIQIIRNFQR